MAGPRVRVSTYGRRRRMGGVVKPSSSTNGQRTTRSIARRAVDSTTESSDDVSRDSSSGEEEGSGEERSGEEGSVKMEPKEEEVEEEKFVKMELKEEQVKGEGFVKMELKEEEVEGQGLVKDEPEESRFVKDEPEEEGSVKHEPEDTQEGGRSHPPPSASPQRQMSAAGQVFLNGRPTIHHPQTAHQEITYTDSFIVTSIHHRPWGAGDHYATIGVYPTESDAREAATRDFLQLDSGAVGWESEWHRRPRGTLEFRARTDDGEDDVEKYTATVKRVQQQQLRIAPISAIRAAMGLPRIRVVKPQYVYFVTTEQRRNNGEADAPRLYACGTDLKSREYTGYMRSWMTRMTPLVICMMD